MPADREVTRSTNRLVQLAVDRGRFLPDGPRRLCAEVAAILAGASLLMIRPAKHQDAPEIEAMIREMHVASKYRDRAGISNKALESVVLGMIAGQGQLGPQGSFCSVAVEDGKIVGFMAGLLDRIYHVGNKLVAHDAFLHARPGARASHALQLIDAYFAWAEGNRRVIEVKLSWNDALPGAERIAKVYERKGFERVGEIYERRLDVAA